MSEENTHSNNKFLKIKVIKMAHQIKELTTKPVFQFLGPIMVKGESLLVFWPPHAYRGTHTHYTHTK